MLKLTMENETLGDRLKRLREAIGKTQSEFSDIVGLSQPGYQSWEGGKSKNPVYPRIPDLLKVAEYYNVSIEWLITGKNNNQKVAEDNISKRIISILQELPDNLKLEVLKYSELQLNSSKQPSAAVFKNIALATQKTSRKSIKKKI